MVRGEGMQRVDNLERFSYKGGQRSGVVVSWEYGNGMEEEDFFVLKMGMIMECLYFEENVFVGMKN